MKKKLALILAPIVLLVVLSVWYVNDYYRSDEIVQQCFALEDGVEIKEISSFQLNILLHGVHLGMTV